MGETRAHLGQLGGDTHNTRVAVGETKISPATVANLTLKWSFTASGDIRTNPTVQGNSLYFTAGAPSRTASGMVYCLNATTGAVIWSNPIAAYVPNSPRATSTTSPAIGATFVVIGVKDPVNGATLLALNKITGALVWRTAIDSLAQAMVRTSVVIAGKALYAGTSSVEEEETHQAGLTVTFQGSVHAVDLTGKILWAYHTVPAGYTGGGVWGSNLVVDTKRNAIYAGTGNNYTIPDAAETCVQQAATQQQQRACLDPSDFEDSVIALDLTTGALKWGKSFVGADTAYYSGPDYDFGSAPNLFTTAINGVATDILGAGQKNGIYYGLNPATGATIWSTQVGPAGPDGGIEWGSATDGTRVYAAIANNLNTPFTLGPPANIPNWQGGSWQALNAATGAVLWQVPVPGNNLVNPQFPAGGFGAMTYANGVVFAPSMSGTMAALNAATGATLWTYTAPASVIAGATVVDGHVYWGSGDTDSKNGGTAGNILYAFGL